MELNTITNPDGSTTYHLPTGITFMQPPLDPLERESSAITLFEAAALGLGELAELTAKVRTDAALTDLGKTQKLDPERSKLVRLVANAWGNLEPFAADLDAREAKLLEVPTVDPTHAAVAVEDREIRDWWRTQSFEARAQMLERMRSGPELQRIELALLRSPVALLDGEARAVRENWERGRRLDNPGETVAIESGRRAIEWARRGLSQVAGLALPVTTWSGDRVLREIVAAAGDAPARGFDVFGFTPEEAARMRRRLDLESKRAA